MINLGSVREETRGKLDAVCLPARALLLNGTELCQSFEVHECFICINKETLLLQVYIPNGMQITAGITFMHSYVNRRFYSLFFSPDSPG